MEVLGLMRVFLKIKSLELPVFRDYMESLKVSIWLTTSAFLKKDLVY